MIAVLSIVSSNFENGCEVRCQNLGVARLLPYFFLFIASFKLYSVPVTIGKVVQKRFAGPVVSLTCALLLSF